MSGETGPGTVADPSVLREDEAILLIDHKERAYLRRLRSGRQIPVRGGSLACDALIGLPEGVTVQTPRGEPLLVLRPTYAQLVPRLPRQAQPIYPKDLGPILLWGDIGPGMRVIEVGVGAGATTIGLLRAVGPGGHLFSYEAREDFAATARQNVARYHGPTTSWTVHVADAFAGFVERNVDRMVVDLAEPWRLLDVAAAALRSGGVITGFVPTALQVKQLVDDLRTHPAFALVETFETLLRPWHVRERSLRPEHRMVAHTGFLVFARRRVPVVAASAATRVDSPQGL